jgi:hypothetical protein
MTNLKDLLSVGRPDFEMSEGRCERELARAVVVTQARCRERKCNAAAPFFLIKLTTSLCRPLTLRLEAGGDAQKLLAY